MKGCCDLIIFSSSLRSFQTHMLSGDNFSPVLDLPYVRIILGILSLVDNPLDTIYDGILSLVDNSWDTISGG